MLAVFLEVDIPITVVVGDEVDVVARPTTGQRGVARLSVEPIVAKEQRPLVGRALRLVDRRRVGVGEVTVSDV